MGSEMCIRDRIFILTDPEKEIYRCKYCEEKYTNPNRCYAEALNVLNGIPFSERSARWYYYSAMANQGAGNNIIAKEHAARAVEMEPSNFEYRQFLQHLEYGGTWYTNMGSSYDRPYSSAGNWCLSMLFLNMLCNCCCLRPF